MNTKTLLRLKEGYTIQDLFNPIEVVDVQNNLQYPILRHKVGVELEVLSCLTRAELVLSLIEAGVFCRASTREDSDYTTWTIKDDGSIRYTEKEVKSIRDHLKRNNIVLKGHEIVSPIITSDILSQVGKVLKHLNKPMTSYTNLPLAIVNDSCGLHIHIDITGVSDFKRENIYNLYKTVEPYLNALMPYKRVQNNTCKEVKGISYCDRLTMNKYWSITLKESLNTFEYRKFYATKNWWYVRCLILLLDQLHSFALENTVLYDAQYNLYDITEYPILWHFISCQRKLIIREQDKILNELETLKLESSKRERIPVVII